MKKRKPIKPVKKPELTQKEQAGRARRAVCTAEDIHEQARELRQVSIELERMTTEIVSAGVLRFIMDGVMTFDRADNLILNHLNHVNRAIGKAQYS
ncbi:MAG: hypothetical protein HQ518_29305 [Rhodopirellula sp.]|nr:hypothetical protein [Rhodopirellula sp.]